MSVRFEGDFRRKHGKTVSRGRIHSPSLAGSGIYNSGPMSAKQAVDDKLMTKEFQVLNKLGIHARPAALFVKTANRFACDIFVEKDGEKVNGKSIMGLMMLAAGPGSKLTIYANGADASKALAEIENLIKRKFDEE